MTIIPKNKHSKKGLKKSRFFDFLPIFKFYSLSPDPDPCSLLLPPTTIHDLPTPATRPPIFHTSPPELPHKSAQFFRAYHHPLYTLFSEYIYNKIYKFKTKIFPKLVTQTCSWLVDRPYLNELKFILFETQIFSHFEIENWYCYIVFIIFTNIFLKLM